MIGGNYFGAAEFGGDSEAALQSSVPIYAWSTYGSDLGTYGDLASAEADTATVIAAAVISSTDHEAYTDSGTNVVGLAVISATEHAAYRDTNTVSGAGVVSSTDHEAATDSTTVIGAAVISSTDHAAYRDAATATGLAVVSESDHEAAHDAATVIAAAVISSTDHAAYLDAATAQGAGVPSSSDHAAYHDDGTPTNLLILSNQADFETSNSSGITVQGSATLTKDTTTKQQGAASVKVVTGGVATSEGLRIGFTSSMTNNPPVAPGRVYVGSAYVKGNLGTEALGIRIGWFTAAGASISTSTVTFTPGTSFGRQSVSAVAPATAAFATLSVLAVTSIQAATFWVDAAQFEEGSTASNWHPAQTGSSETVTGIAVISATEQEADHDTATVIGSAVISSSDHAAYHDTTTSVIGAAVVSSTDAAAYHDAATVQGAGVPSQSDSEASTDANTVVALAVISSTDHAAYHDAASVSGAGVVSESDQVADHEANTVIGLAVISSHDQAHYLDANSVVAVGIPSDTEVYTPSVGAVAYTDAATVRSFAVISSVEHYHASPHPPRFAPRLRGYYLSGRMTIKLGVPA